MSLSAFQRPRETIDWAREAVEELEGLVAGYFNGKPFYYAIDHDPKTGHDVHKIRLGIPLPPKVGRLGTESINNLKNSFDQSLFAATAAIRKTRKGNLHFPWRDSPRDLNRRLDKMEKEFAIADFRDVLCRQEPYPRGDGYAGGDDHIRELARIANGKHTVGLAISSHGYGGRYPSVSGRVDFFEMPMPYWDPVNDEMVVAVVSKGAKVGNDYQLKFGIGFSEPGPLKGFPLVAGLNHFLKKAELVYDDLRQRAIELGAR